jgi:hypothetical protein
VCFSIGLGAVLTGIGVSLVTGKAVLVARIREGGALQRLLAVLPSLSALFIAALGAFFCASTFVSGRTEIAAMLRQIADWIK